MSHPTDGTESTESTETKPGPANPRPEGVDAPTPPGGPQRQDGAGGTAERGRTPAQDGPEPAHGGTIPVEDEQTHPDPGTEESEAEQENAETSLDQPSS